MRVAEIRAQSNRAHAIMRARQRYSLRLTHQDLKVLEENLKWGKQSLELSYVRGMKNRVRCAVRIEGEWYPVVYDRATKSIVTFLPEEVLFPYREALGK